MNKQASLIGDIKGVGLDHPIVESFNLKNGVEQLVEIKFDLPSGGRVLPPGSVKTDNTFDISQTSIFQWDFKACLPFPRVNLVYQLYPLKLSKTLQQETDGYELNFLLRLAVLDCEGFQPLYDVRRLHGAIDRNLYTRWGPGAFKYEFDTG